MLNRGHFRQGMDLCLGYHFNETLETAEPEELYLAAANMLMPFFDSEWETVRKSAGSYTGKTVYYISMEWILRRTLGRLFDSLTEKSEIQALLEEMEIDLKLLEKQEREVHVGNHGTGYEAWTAKDTAELLNTDQLVYGCGMRYQYGALNLQNAEGQIIPMFDEWLKHGYPYERYREREAIDVRVGDFTVVAVPYDIPVIGRNNGDVKTLRLWSTKQKHTYDYDGSDLDERRRYIEEEHVAETISACLWRPDEPKMGGKVTCLNQQYFFASASVQWAVKQHIKKFGDIRAFHKENKLLLHDERCVMVIPELMRILIDEYELPWEEARKIVKNSCVFIKKVSEPEIWKQWPEQVVRKVAPRIQQIIEILTFKG